MTRPSSLLNNSFRSLLYEQHTIITAFSGPRLLACLVCCSVFPSSEKVSALRTAEIFSCDLSIDRGSRICAESPEIERNIR